MICKDNFSVEPGDASPLINIAVGDDVVVAAASVLKLAAVPSILHLRTSVEAGDTVRSNLHTDDMVVCGINVNVPAVVGVPVAGRVMVCKPVDVKMPDF